MKIFWRIIHEKPLYGDYPVIGIRPIVDGRRGTQMMRESLEPLVWAMAESAKKLFEEKPLLL